MSHPVYTSQSVQQLLPNLWPTLKVVQRKAVVYALNRQCRALLCMDPGLGKTLAFLALIRCMEKLYDDPDSSTVKHSPFPVLILTKSKIASSFKKEIIRWLGVESKQIQLWIGAKKPKTVNPDCTFVISTYQTCARRVECLTPTSFGTVCVDESQVFGNRSSQLTLTLTPVVQAAPYAVFLSGTPMERPLNIWPQMHMLKPSLPYSQRFMTFAYRFCAPKKQFIGPQRYTMDYRGQSNMKELNTLLTTELMFRCSKDQADNWESQGSTASGQPPTKVQFSRRVQWFCPDRQRQERLQRLCQNSQDQKDFLKQREETWQQERDWSTVEETTDRDVERLQANAEVNRLRQATSLIKVKELRPELTALIQSHLDADPTNKLIICAEFKRVLDHDEKILSSLLVSTELEQKNSQKPQEPQEPPKKRRRLTSQYTRKTNPVPWIRIDGRSSSPDAIGRMIDRFQTDPSCRVALLAIRAGGVGITLTAANLVIMQDINYSARDMIQAECRAVREGQQRHVNIIYILLSQSIDEQVWSIVKQKLKTVANVIDNQTKSSFQATKELISMDDQQSTLERKE